MTLPRVCLLVCVSTLSACPDLPAETAGSETDASTGMSSTTGSSGHIPTGTSLPPTTVSPTSTTVEPPHDTEDTLTTVSSSSSSTTGEPPHNTDDLTLTSDSTASSTTRDETSSSSSSTTDDSTTTGTTTSSTGTTDDSTTTSSTGTTDDSTTTSSTGTTDDSTGTTDDSSTGTTGEPIDNFTPHALEVADFDADGHNDILLMGVDPDTGVEGHLALGVGDGTFAAPVIVGFTASSVFPLVGALDDLPGVDLMLAESPTTAGVYHWKEGTFAKWTTLVDVVGLSSRAVFDVDGDAHGDVVTLWNGLDDFGLAVSRGDGSGFAPPLTTVLGTKVDLGHAPGTVRVGRFDGDGFGDALMFQPGKSGLVRTFGNPDASFDLPDLVLLQVHPILCELGDLDGDAHLDLVIAEHDPSRLVLATGDGLGGFSVAATVDIDAPFAPSNLANGDLDGDGDLDVVAVDKLQPNLLVWTGNGDGTLGPAQSTALKSGAVRVHAAPLDAGPAADIVAATFAAGELTIVLNP